MFILVLVSDIVVVLVKNILVISFGNCMYLFQVGYIRDRSTGVEGLLKCSFRRCCKHFLPAAVLLDALTTSLWERGSLLVNTRCCIIFNFIHFDRCALVFLCGFNLISFIILILNTFSYASPSPSPFLCKVHFNSFVH